MQGSSDPSLTDSAIAVAILAAIALAVIGGLLFVVDGWAIVQDGERGVYTRMGEVQGTVGPGFHTKIPLIDGIQTYEVRSQAYTMSSQQGEGGGNEEEAKRDDAIKALTMEGLNVNVSMTVRYHIKPGKVDSLYKNVSTQQSGVTERVVRPTAREAVRSCSAQFSVEGIYSNKRDEFGACVNERVTAQYESKGLAVEVVQIRNVMLPWKVRQAIQNKQAAQEKIETKKKELEIEELEKERRIIEAEGISESQRIIDESLTQAYLQWFWIQEGLEKGDAIYVPISEGGMELYKDVDRTNVGGNESDSSGNESSA